MESHQSQTSQDFLTLPVNHPKPVVQLTVERKGLSGVQVPKPQRALVFLFHAKWESQDKREVMIIFLGAVIRKE